LFAIGFAFICSCAGIERINATSAEQPSKGNGNITTFATIVRDAQHKSPAWIGGQGTDP